MRAATSACPSTTAAACSAARRGPSRAGRSGRGREARRTAPGTGRSPSRPASPPRRVAARAAHVRWRERPRATPASREPGSPVGSRPRLERLADGRAHVLGERHLGALGEVAGEHAERLVRVDPAPAPAARSGSVPSKGSPDVCASRWRTVEPGGPAGSSRSTTPSSAATSAASAATGFETEASRTGAVRIAERRRCPSAIDDARGCELDGPAVDLAKCLHARRY